MAEICGTAGTNNTTITVGDYYPTTTDGSNWVAWQGDTIYPPNDGWKSEYIQKEEVKEMRGLFEVFVVDPKRGEIVYGDIVVAKDTETAMFKVLQEGAKVIPLTDVYDLDELDFICNRLGDVRKKKEVQRVRVVKEE